MLPCNRGPTHCIERDRTTAQIKQVKQLGDGGQLIRWASTNHFPKLYATPQLLRFVAEHTQLCDTRRISKERTWAMAFSG